MTSRSALALLTTAALTAGAAGTATAVVPPRNCGTTTVDGKRYQIKADQITCTTAKRYARRYIDDRDEPRSWNCRRYSSRSTSLWGRCTYTRSNPDRVIHIIRR